MNARKILYITAIVAGSLSVAHNCYMSKKIDKELNEELKGTVTATQKSTSNNKQLIKSVQKGESKIINPDTIQVLLGDSTKNTINKLNIKAAAKLAGDTAKTLK